LGLFLSALLLTTAVRADPLESWYRRRGQENMKIGNYKAAIEAYEKILSQDPNDREALRALAKAYQQQGLVEKAIEMTDRYLKSTRKMPMSPLIRRRR